MKQSYQVVPQSVSPQQDDASFRVCLCTILVLLALFGLTSILLWRSVEHPVQDGKHDSASGSSSLYGQIKHDPTSITADQSEHEVTNSVAETSHSSTGEQVTQPTNTTQQNNSVKQQKPTKTVGSANVSTGQQVTQSTTTTQKNNSVKQQKPTKTVGSANVSTGQQATEPTTTTPQNNSVKQQNPTPAEVSTGQQVTQPTTTTQQNNSVKQQKPTKTVGSENVSTGQQVTQPTTTTPQNNSVKQQNPTTTTVGSAEVSTGQQVIQPITATQQNNSVKQQNPTTTTTVGSAEVSTGQQVTQPTTTTPQNNSVKQQNPTTTVGSAEVSTGQQVTQPTTTTPQNISAKQQNPTTTTVRSAEVSTGQQVIQPITATQQNNSVKQQKPTTTTVGSAEVSTGQQVTQPTTTTQQNNSVKQQQPTATTVGSADVSTGNVIQSNVLGISQSIKLQGGLLTSTVVPNEDHHTDLNLIEIINKQLALLDLSSTTPEYNFEEELVSKGNVKSGKLIAYRFVNFTEEMVSTDLGDSSESATSGTPTIPIVTSSNQVTNTSRAELTSTQGTPTKTTRGNTADEIEDVTPTVLIQQNTTNELDSAGDNSTFLGMSSPDTDMPQVCPTCVAPTCPACPVSTCATTTSVPKTTVTTADRVCQTSQCYVTAGRILSLVNISVGPCEDFYSYACGGILDNPTLLEEDPAVDVWNRIEKAVKEISPRSPGSHRKMKNYYEGCVHYDKLISEAERKVEGRKILESVGQFVNATSNPENDITGLLINLFKLGSKSVVIDPKLFCSEPLFRLQLDVDSVNSTRFQVVITVPDWSSSHFLSFDEKNVRCRHKPSAKIPLNLADAYLAYRNCRNNFTDFFETTQKALEYFEVFDYMTDYESSQLIQEIRMSIEFDILELLGELPTPDVVNENVQHKNFKLIMKTQLEATIPQVSWGYLFSTLLNVDLDDSSYVQVYFLDEISELFRKLQAKNERTIHNSLLAILAHNLYTDLVMTHSPCDREHYCLRVAASLMPAIVSNLYLSTFPTDTDRELRTQVESLYQQLEATFEAKLTEADWLDNKTLDQVERKLKFMSIQLPQMFSDSFLNTSLGECELSRKHYLNDSVCLLNQYQILLYSRYTLDPHSSDALWPHFLTAFSTRTAFIYGVNAFMVPLAVVGPVYDQLLPRHFVMARLGNVLARGIAHNFDPTGVKFDAAGKIGVMLSEDTHPTYEDVVDTANSQFYFPKSHRETGRTYSYQLQPELTVNQRLSDITAANLALSSILELSDTQLPWVPFTSKQLYFISLAQAFCSKKKMAETFTTLYEATSLLPFQRVENLATNSEEFALTFQCPLGSNMHPVVKVRPFPEFKKNELNLINSY